MKTFIKVIIKISITIALLIFLFSKINLKQTIFYIHTVDISCLISAFLLFLIVMFLALSRWIILLKSLGKPIPFGHIFTAYCGGLFFNLFLPSAIGGDIARVVDLSIHTKDTPSIFATVFLDRFSGMIGLVFVAFVSFLFGYLFGITCDIRFFLFISILTLFLIALYFILFNKRVFSLIKNFLFFNLLKEYLTKFHNACYQFSSKKIILFKANVLSAMLQALFSIVCYFIGKSIGIEINIIYYFILIPIVNTITMLPISIGGLGLRDNAAVVLFSVLGVASDKIVAMTLISFSFPFFLGIVGGIIYGIALYNRRI